MHDLVTLSWKYTVSIAETMRKIYKPIETDAWFMSGILYKDSGNFKKKGNMH